LGIIHRDLKPPNLLLQYNDPNNQEEIPKVLISDFGECEILSHIEKRQRTGATGTLEFMAVIIIILHLYVYLYIYITILKSIIKNDY